MDMHSWIRMLAPIILLLMLGFRVFILAKDGSGSHSFSITGIQVMLVVIVAVVIMDTYQDRGKAQSNMQANTSTVSKSASRTRNSSVTSRQSSNGVVRSVIKEKYWLLGMMFLAFCILYLLSHRRHDMKDWTVKGAMAIRGKDPFEHDVDKALIKVLEEDPHGAETRDFFIQGILARKGVDSVKQKKGEAGGEAKDSALKAPDKPVER